MSKEITLHSVTKYMCLTCVREDNESNVQVMITRLVWTTWTSCLLSTKRLLTHWGRVKHICVGKLAIKGSDNGLSPGRRQAIIRTNAGILLIGTLGTNFSEILSQIQTFSFKKMHLKMSFGRWRPFCLSLSVLKLITHSHSKKYSWQTNFSFHQQNV